MNNEDQIIGHDDGILITGANGFIGSKVVEQLVAYGFKNLRCLTRSTELSGTLKKTIASSTSARITIVTGNLLSSADCEKAVEGIKVIYHLAAAVQAKAFDEAYANSVDTTKNLLEAALKKTTLSRFVLVSSFAVYSNVSLGAGALLDESCPLESDPQRRGEAYSYAKLKQEELVRDYGRNAQVPYFILRPGAVYGPGRAAITGRVGISKRGLMLHMGGANVIPFTYVDNCAEAIVVAGLKKGVDGEVVNVVDDGALTSREFLKMYRRNARKIRSVPLPKPLSYLLFCLLGFLLKLLKGSSSGYTVRRWSAYWKGNIYTNNKLKKLLGWRPTVSMEEGMKRYFAYCKANGTYEG